MVDRNSISEMTKLIAIMNNAEHASEVVSPKKSNMVVEQRQKPVAPYPTRSEQLHENKPNSDNVDVMRQILETFTNAASKSVDNLLEETRLDRPLREAMTTQQIESGVAIGFYEIMTKKESGRTLYDVKRIDEMRPIAQDLTLYEAARGLVAALNDGLPITSRPIRDFLKIEEEFANAVNDAIHSKAILRRNIGERRVVLEDKYTAALRRADNARARITKLVERYPFSEI